jgi:hypothetical protein
MIPEQSKEARILIATEALWSNPKLSVCKAAKTYNVPESTLHNRMNGATYRAEIWPKNQLLDKLEEKVLLQHILNLDTRGFLSKIEDIKDIANYILVLYRKRPVSKL